MNRRSRRQTTIIHRVRPFYDQGMAATIRVLALRTANTGLIFDRYPDIWSGVDGQPPWKPETPHHRPSVKQEFLEEIRSFSHINKEQVQNLLDSLHIRRKILVESLGGCFITARTEWRFVSGLGMAHVLDNGFVWDRNLGVPYLPGSSIKGMVRAWVKNWQNDTPQVWQEARALFGDDKELGAGEVVVFDAYPLHVPELKVDVMNVHYKEYYDKNMDANGKRVPPADYLSPIPIFFLAVALGTKFNFALAPRVRASNSTDSLIRAKKLLCEALATLGAGAKTAVGYGHLALQQ